MGKARAIETEGFTELVNDLAKMASVLADDQGDKFKQTAKRILSEAGNPMLADMIRRAPKRSGTLKEALKIGTVPTRKKDGGYTIKIGSQKGDDAYYASWVEFGHGGPRPAAPHPFIRPAYDTTKEESYRIIRERLQDELKKIGG